MARKKKGKTSSRKSSLGNRLDLAWKNFKAFVILFALSFILYNLSSNELFVNFFGVISIILGFLSFALLIAIIVLSLVRKRSR